MQRAGEQYPPACCEVPAVVPQRVEAAWVLPWEATHLPATRALGTHFFPNTPRGPPNPPPPREQHKSNRGHPRAMNRNARQKSDSLSLVERPPPTPWPCRRCGAASAVVTFTRPITPTAGHAAHSAGRKGSAPGPQHSGRTHEGWHVSSRPPFRDSAALRTLSQYPTGEAPQRRAKVHVEASLPAPPLPPPAQPLPQLRQFSSSHARANPSDTIAALYAGLLALLLLIARETSASHEKPPLGLLQATERAAQRVTG